MTKTMLLFFATVLCEIIGCFLPWLWLKRNASIWLLPPMGIPLVLFVWLLTLYPAMNGRVYAAYGGVYICAVLIWLRAVGSVKLILYDQTRTLIALCDMLITVAGWGRTQEHESILSVRYEEVSADERYSVSPFVDHSWRRYTPFFAITPAFLDLHTCMVVAQLRRFHASRQAM